MTSSKSKPTANDQQHPLETIEYDGLTLGFLKAGNPDKPALVLLHGWPQSKEVYDQVIDDLAVDHFVLAFDLPGIGDSRGAPKSAEKRTWQTS